MVAKSTSAALVFWSKVSPQTTEVPSSLCLCSVCLYVLKFCGKPVCTCATKIKSYRDLTRKYQDIQTKVLRYYLFTSNLAFYEKKRFFMLCNKEFGSGNALNRLDLVSCDTPTCFVQWDDGPEFMSIFIVVIADCNKYRTGGAWVASGAIGPIKFWPW